ncbi:MAG: YfiR family protein [Ginsengibacter sp.]
MNLLIKRFLLLMLAGCFLGTISAQNAQQEANLKAAFIFNFTKYIDWGSHDLDSNFVIGVAGDSPIVASLKTIAISSTINNKKIVIKIINKGTDIENCNVVFIPKDCPFPLNYILEKTGPGVLTISDQPGFAEAGTAFNFVLIHNRLKFEANLKAISSAGLKAGSQLLKLAILVD